MNQQPKSKKNTYKQREIKTVYSLSQITKKISLPINAIGRNLQKTIEETIDTMVSGKCIVEGYVKPHSIRVITFSSGLIKGTEILFDVVFECEVCFPVAGMLFNCIAKNITKAGIRAESVEEIQSPFVLFVARDHYYASDYFNSIKENDKFVAKVIAQRFELNDKYVSIIAELVTPKRMDIRGPAQAQAQPRIEFEE
jgi:DNA-directed RNA polymerase subunit E'/Rpb7